MRLRHAVITWGGSLSIASAMPLSAQTGSPAFDSARYAVRRAAAFDRLGPNLLVVQSRWAPGQWNGGFDQDASFYYFTGAERLIGAILVLDGSSRRAEVFVGKPTPGSLTVLGAGLAAARAARLGVDRVSDWNTFAAYIEQWLGSHPRGVMFVDDGGIEATSFAGALATPFDSLAALANPHAAFAAALRTRWPNAAIASDTGVGPTVRAVKDSAEIAVMRRVAANSSAAFLAGLPRFGAGRRQREVEAAVVETCTRLGDGPSFWPWAMSGPNAAFPRPFMSFLDPHNLDREMKSGEVARFDIGCKVDRYLGDVGRTIPVTGTFTPDQREVVDLLVAVYRAGLATIRDGADTTEVLRASVAEAARHRSAMRTALGKRAAALLSEPDSLPFWQHHGIGLDIAEPLPRVLRAGMVLDYEPIFVVDGQGFYMEDMILVTKAGYEILTKGLPSTAAEIEQAMRRRRAATSPTTSSTPDSSPTPGGALPGPSPAPSTG
jgi:Xaa-Pro aminopeptidase